MKTRTTIEIKTGCGCSQSILVTLEGTTVDIGLYGGELSYDATIVDTGIKLEDLCFTLGRIANELPECLKAYEYLLRRIEAVQEARLHVAELWKDAYHQTGSGFAYWDKKLETQTNCSSLSRGRIDGALPWKALGRVNATTMPLGQNYCWGRSQEEQKNATDYAVGA